MEWLLGVESGFERRLRATRIPIDDVHTPDYMVGVGDPLHADLAPTDWTSVFQGSDMLVGR
jgi:hypothetical protein